VDYFAVVIEILIGTCCSMS